MRTPYTYRIAWSLTGMNYYGVRYAKGCHPSELFVTYFTSSNHVADYIKEHGMPDIIEIRKAFTEQQVSESREYEHRVLKRLVGSPIWLNKTHNKSQPPLYGKDNPSSKPENKAKISAGTKLTTPRGDDHPRRKNTEKWAHLSELFSGRDNWWSKGDLNSMRDPEKKAKCMAAIYSPEAVIKRQAYADRRRGIPKPEVSVALKGVPKEKVTCPQCGKIGGKNIMGRWHFNNCKHKTT